MESLIHSWIDPLPTWALFLVIGFFIYTLSKGADLLVEEAVVLSVRWGVPTLLIGATIVSLGTTLPEAAVSVLAAVQGRPELALGNAVGSIIVDTGLILGLAALIRPIPLDKKLLNRQGYIQLGAGFLLVLVCVPWSTPGQTFSTGGGLPQFVGWVFLGLLVLYIYKTISWAKNGNEPQGQPAEVAEKASMVSVSLKLFLGIAIVILSSKFLIPTVELTAVRLEIPKSVIAATLVAFGTSLPELITAITAVRKGQGALALGNVIGADILNVLFVAGTSAAVTQGGLIAEPRFFQILFPGMLGLLILFRVCVLVSRDTLGRGAGGVLIAGYLLVSISSYLF